MNKIVVSLLMLVPACHPTAKQVTQGPGQTGQGATAVDEDMAGGGALSGLYQRPVGKQINELCLIGRRDGSTHFGIVVWGANLSSCSGIGIATRTPNGLRLAMTGDSACTMGAIFSDGTVTLPRSLPSGCAYYCGASASFAETSFIRKASGRAAALKARDLVGDPLCSNK